MDSNKLRLEQMDAVFGNLEERALPPAPAGGWLRAIRQALGMTTRQLAARVGVQLSTLLTAERNEAAGTIGLNQLRRVAAALDCEVRYVVVPREPLKKRLEKRAEEIARRRMGDVAHSMALEAQATSEQFRDAQVARIKEELLRGRWSKLWEPGR
ncbi:MAG: mobile mystery protein A [Lysobacteraceae bacterium]|nr:MAG: mobile mystery protein A [Xanthomonadaceae bacterium]